jgi:hypothetical protein
MRSLPRREAGAAEAAQAAVGKLRDHVLGLARTGQACAQHGVATRFRRRPEVVKRGDMRIHASPRRQLEQAGRGGVIDVMVPHLGGRSRCARADAGRAQYPDAGGSLLLQFAKQRLRSGQHAAQAVAHPDRDLWRTLLALPHHIKVGIERGDLVNFGHRYGDLFCQRLQVSLGQTAFGILNEVQIFDQKRPLTRAIAQQGLHRCSL